LSDRSIGWAAFNRNRDAVIDAIYELLKRDCTHLCARGHSLGGALAQYAYLAHPAISNCVTYQSAAIAIAIADANPDRGFATTHYLHRDDVIPVLSIRKTRGWFIPGRQVVFRPPDRYRGARRIVAHTMPLMPLL
jgi:pimeloyl-ACP methyl ester carboxylesterase